MTSQNPVQRQAGLLFIFSLCYIAINYNYKNTDLVERISEKVVEDSLVRSIPFKSKSKYVLILKSILIKIFEFFGLMRFIGNN